MRSDVERLISSLFDLSCELKRKRLKFCIKIWFKNYGNEHEKFEKFIKGIKQIFLNTQPNLLLLNEKCYILKDFFFVPLKLFTLYELKLIYNLILSKTLKLVNNEYDIIKFQFCEKINPEIDRNSVLKLCYEIIIEQITQICGKNIILKEQVINKINEFF